MLGLIWLTVAILGPDPAEDKVLAELVELHNKAREDEHLPPLKLAPLLTEAAKVQADDMARRDEMSHEGADGSTPSERVKRVGYRYYKTGENVAMFYPRPKEVMQAWLDSPHHRENIMGDYTEMGLARTKSSMGKWYWCVEFGKPIPQFTPQEATKAVLGRLNQARADAKVEPVTTDDDLIRVAQKRTVDQLAEEKAARERKAQEKDPSKAADPKPADPKPADPKPADPFAGLDVSRFGQLAMSQGVGYATGEELVDSFLKMDAYKDRLIDPKVSKVGVGYSTDPDGSPRWCLILTAPRPGRK